jgi:hypothetical protein
VILFYSRFLSGQALGVPDSLLAVHLALVMKTLPQESGPPPLVDLSKANTRGASQKWEARFTGAIVGTPISDPGVREPSLAGGNLEGFPKEAEGRGS